MYRYVQAYADSLLEPNDKYDPERCVVKRKVAAVVRKEVIPQLSKMDKTDKNIQYFLKMNSGWESVTRLGLSQSIMRVSLQGIILKLKCC